MLTASNVLVNSAESLCDRPRNVEQGALYDDLRQGGHVTVHLFVSRTTPNVPDGF